jgi:hypothetical protein
MTEHEHPAEDQPATKPSRDAVSMKAYAIYLKGGHETR